MVWRIDGPPLSMNSCPSLRDSSDISNIISVVIPCFNAERWIERAIKSIICQQAVNAEIMVVDDGSTDGSCDVVAGFGDRVLLERGAHRGACIARNRGMTLSGGSFVLFLDADDYLDPDAISAWLKHTEAADIVLGQFVRERDGIREKGNEIETPKDAVSLLTNWNHGHFTPPCAVLWRRSFLESIGGWAEDLLKNQDGELVARALLKGARVSHASTGLGIYVQHDYPLRVSRRRGFEVLKSEFAAFNRLSSLPNGSGHDLQSSLGAVFYGLARQAYEQGFDELGRQSIRRARELGFRGHTGSFAHKLTSNLLGQRLKARLSNFISTFKQ